MAFVRTTVSRDPAIVELVAARDDYPGASAQLDAADRVWLRAQGVEPPPRAEVSMHEAARLARREAERRRKRR